MGDNRDQLDQRPLAHANGAEATTHTESDLTSELRALREELHEIREDNRQLRQENRELREQVAPKLDRIEKSLGRTTKRDPPEIVRAWDRDQFVTFVVSRPTSGQSTAIKYANALERMEAWGVSLRPPSKDDYRAFLAHKSGEGRSNSTLNLYRSAMLALLEFLDEKSGDAWQPFSLDGAYPIDRKPVELPPNDRVPEFWRYDYFPDDPLKTTVTQYLFRALFLTGIRPPSEPAVLTWDDVNFETRTIQVRQPKKDGKVNVRPRQPTHLMTAGNAKSLKLYKEHWWPKLDPETNHVFVKWDGTPWPQWDRERPFDQLRGFLRRHGPKVWDGYWPYCSRHWFATELQRQTGNAHLVARELGDSLSTVDETYIDRQTLRADDERSWPVPPLGPQERETGGI